jgi:hypothetical protein
LQLSLERSKQQNRTTSSLAQIFFTVSEPKEENLQKLPDELNKNAAPFQVSTSKQQNEIEKKMKIPLTSSLGKPLEQDKFGESNKIKSFNQVISNPELSLLSKNEELQKEHQLKQDFVNRTKILQAQLSNPTVRIRIRI